MMTRIVFPAVVPLRVYVSGGTQAPDEFVDLTGAVNKLLLNASSTMPAAQGPLGVRDAAPAIGRVLGRTRENSGTVGMFGAVEGHDVQPVPPVTVPPPALTARTASIVVAPGIRLGVVIPTPVPDSDVDAVNGKFVDGPEKTVNAFSLAQENANENAFPVCV